MHRPSILAVAATALCFTAATAHAAGGINLSWDDCGAFGSAQKNFACDTNTGTNLLVLSVIPPGPMPQLNGAATSIEIQTNQATLSNWWQFDSGGCRQGVVTARFDFTLSGPFNCTDPWQGLCFGGLSNTQGFQGPNRLRFRTVCAVAAGVPVNDQDELHITDVLFNNSKTVNDCAGCTDGACFVLQKIEITQPAGVGDYIVTNPILRQYVTWQSGVGDFTNNQGIGCPGATPTRKATWGSIKSMYR